MSTLSSKVTDLEVSTDDLADIYQDIREIPKDDYARAHELHVQLLGALKETKNIINALDEIIELSISESETMVKALSTFVDPMPNTKKMFGNG